MYLTVLVIVGSQVPIVGLDARSMSASPDYTASMTISKTERSRVRNIYENVVTPAFPLARHTFMGTPFPCKNIYGDGVPAPLHPCSRFSGKKTFVLTSGVNCLV